MESPTSKKEAWKKANRQVMDDLSAETNTSPGVRKPAISLASLTTSFLGHTSAHGIPRIVSSKEWYRKAVWISIFLLAVGYFTYQCTTLFSTFFNYPIAIETLVNTKTSIEFPAVTVCNMNMMKKELLVDSDKYSTLVKIDEDTRDEVEGLWEEWSGWDVKKRKRRSASGQNEKGDNSLENLLIEEELHIHQAMKVKRLTSAEEISVPPQMSQLPSSSKIPPLSERMGKKRGDRGKRSTYDDDYYDGSGYDTADWEDSWIEEYGEEWFDDEGWEMDWFEEFDYEDSKFTEMENDYEFEKFIKVSQTDDYSDMVETLKPTIEELDKFGHQAKDFIVQCSFDKHNCSIADFYKVYNGYYGNCYTFNHAKDINNTILKTSKYGSRYGLRLSLNIEYDQYLGLFSHSAGARVAVHPPNVNPFPEDYGVSAPPGKETEIGVTTETITRQKYPYPSNCTDGSGYAMIYDGDYTVMGCSQSCLQVELHKQCGCVNSLVVTRNFSRCSLTNKTQERCGQRIEFLHEENRLGCDCPQACTETKYPSTISTSNWPSDPYTWFLSKGILKNRQSFISQEYGLSQSIQRNLVRLHVYIEDPSVRAIEESPSYPWDRLLADIGGLLGLFIGVSALTAMELVEYMADAIVVCCRRTKKKGTEIKPMENENDKDYPVVKDCEKYPVI